MIIDDYDAAISLTEKLKQSLPIKARAAKPFLKTLKQRGDGANPDREFEIESVDYSGDAGGIMCVLVADPNTKERYVVSITHLIIHPNHSLASEVQAYQRQRTRKLMLQNQAGFASEMLALIRLREGESAVGVLGSD